MTLPEYIASHLDSPFAWGRNDCVLFAARWIELSTGNDPLRDLEHWTTMRQAMGVLKIVGGLEAATDAKLQRIDPNFAGDGDIALHRSALRLFSGRHICGPGVDGLLFFDRTEAKCAWRCS